MSIPSVTAGAPPAELTAVARPAAAPSAAAASTTPVAPNAGAEPTAEASGTVTHPQPGQDPDRETLLQAVEDVRKALAPVAQDLQFSIDDDTGRTVVKVVDSSTDEVIRQIPSKEVLAIAKALDKLQGVLLKQEA